MRTNQLSLNPLWGLGIFPRMAKAASLLPPEAGALDYQDAAAIRTPAEAPARRRGFLERLDDWYWAQYQRDVESYLARSTDVCDLEARMRALERKAVQPYY
jgi:hypothetical protein